MKTKISRKKFYNKYDYKISLSVPGCEYLRYTGLSDSIALLEKGKVPFYYSEKRKLAVLKNRNILLDLGKILLSKSPDQWCKRIERETIDIYSTDKNFIYEIHEKFKNETLNIFETLSNDLEPFTISVKKLPNDIYNYRVYLLPHKLKNNKELKSEYILWIRGQSTKIKMTETVENWFLTTEWNWDPRYVLVDNESTLLMLKLRNSEVIGRIYKFVVR